MFPSFIALSPSSVDHLMCEFLSMSEPHMSSHGSRTLFFQLNNETEIVIILQETGREGEKESHFKERKGTISLGLERQKRLPSIFIFHFISFLYFTLLWVDKIAQELNEFSQRFWLFFSTWSQQNGIDWHSVYMNPPGLVGSVLVERK